MNLPHDLWTALPVIAVCATLTVVGLVLVRIVRKRRAHRQTASCEALRANLIAYIATKSEDPLVEAELDRSGFVAVALHLLTQIDGVSREQLVDLMHRRTVDKRLRRALRWSTQAKRIAAAGALRFFPSPETRNVLRRALHDNNLEVRLTAASSLIEINAAPPLNELLPAVAYNGRCAPARLEPILRYYCERQPSAVVAAARQRSLHPLIRAKVIETLASTDGGPHVAAIQSLVAAPEADLRAAVLRAFGKHADPKSREAIALSLRDENWFVRATAADAAGRLGLLELVPQIVPLVDDEQWWVRFRASEALEKLDPVGRRALRQITKTGSIRQRRQAALTLSKRLVA